MRRACGKGQSGSRGRAGGHLAYHGENLREDYDQTLSRVVSKYFLGSSHASDCTRHWSHSYTDANALAGM